MIAAMHQQQIVIEERERIGRELHDGTVQKIYTAGLLVESATHLSKENKPLKQRLERAAAALNDTIIDLRNNLGELHSPSASTPLTTSLKKIAEDPRFNSLVNIQLTMDIHDSTTLSPHRTDHVMAIVNGALSNTIRHAKARNVKISISQINKDMLDLVIQDDGLGFPKDYVNGYGMRNMSDRARLLEGKIEFENGAEKGTMVHLTLPLEEET